MIDMRVAVRRRSSAVIMAGILMGARPSCRARRAPRSVAAAADSGGVASSTGRSPARSAVADAWPAITSTAYPRAANSCASVHHSRGITAVAIGRDEHQTLDPAAERRELEEQSQAHRGSDIGERHSCELARAGLLEPAQGGDGVRSATREHELLGHDARHGDVRGGLGDVRSIDQRDAQPEGRGIRLPVDHDGAGVGAHAAGGDEAEHGGALLGLGDDQACATRSELDARLGEREPVATLRHLAQLDEHQASSSRVGYSSSRATDSVHDSPAMLSTARTASERASEAEASIRVITARAVSSTSRASVGAATSVRSEPSLLPGPHDLGESPTHRGERVGRLVHVRFVERDGCRDLHVGGLPPEQRGEAGECDARIGVVDAEGDAVEALRPDRDDGPHERVAIVEVPVEGSPRQAGRAGDGVDRGVRVARDQVSGGREDVGAVLDRVASWASLCGGGGAHSPRVANLHTAVQVSSRTSVNRCRSRTQRPRPRHPWRRRAPLPRH